MINIHYMKLLLFIIMVSVVNALTPQNDFYHFINKEWIDNNPIPDDQIQWGTFTILQDSTEKKLYELLDRLPNDNNALTMLWNQGNDEAMLNAESPDKILKNWIDEIEDIDSLEDFNTMAIKMMEYDIDSVIKIDTYSDMEESGRNILYIYPSGLGLPDRDYYLTEDTLEKRLKYKQYMKVLTQRFNLNLNIDEVYRIEEEMAKVRLSKTELRDPYKRYNLYTMNGLETLCPRIDWRKIFTKYNIPTDDKISVTQPLSLQRLNEMLCDKLGSWKDFLLWKLIDFASGYLDDETYNINFDFRLRTLYGQSVSEARWSRVLRTINDLVGELLGKLYVERYFSEQSKKIASELISELRAELGRRIEALTWMTDETKVKAFDKLNTFRVKVGYPDVWTDFSTLNVNKDVPYLMNILGISRWNFLEKIKTCYKPVDRERWLMSPHQVNAYYYPPLNEIVFPAAILQAPFFDENFAPAINFGGIGTVIGHEMTHGFDDKGRKYDAYGNLNDWWTPKDSELYDAETRKLKDQFNAYSLFGNNINGELTLGENIADLGGLTIAYHALCHYLGDNMTDEDRRNVFVSYATIWRTNAREDYIKKQIITDPHSPAVFRVNGIVRNMSEFISLYNVTDNDELYMPVEKRVKIW